MLSDDELKELILEAQGGSQAAKDTLVQQNLNLVRSVTYRFVNRGYEWDDLFQIGCVGLIKAINKFDFSFDVKFSTYAVPMIIGEIRRFMRDDNAIKVNRPTKETAYRIYKIQESLQGQLGREPSISEIAKEMNMAPQEIVAALEAVQPPASLYESVFRDGGEPILLLDQIACTESLDQGFFDKLALKELLCQISKKERIVLELRFFEDKTQAEISSIIGLSQVQVSRIEKSALKTIRKLIKTS